MTDNRENVEIDITDEEFLSIAKMAHERDITFNQMVGIILQAEIDRIKSTESVDSALNI